MQHRALPTTAAIATWSPTRMKDCVPPACTPSAHATRAHQRQEALRPSWGPH